MDCKNRSIGLLILPLLLFAISVQSQIKPDPGKIKSDLNFDCNTVSRIVWDTAISRLEKICESKNKLEIRLIGYYLPHGDCDLIILSFNDNKWEARKYSKSKGFIGDKVTYTRLMQNPDLKKMDDNNFNLVFDTLKANNIFLLPDQDELKLKGRVFDGARYKLFFKVDDKFRTYSFNNPDSYMDENKPAIELKYYKNIVLYLNTLFN